jgi:glycine betaine catabolism B
MTMRTKEHNNSTQLWTKRLFQQAGKIVKAGQDKHYFTQRYHGNSSALGQNPFAALFSDSSSGDAQTMSLNKTFVSENAVLPAIKTTSITQFTVLSCYNETQDTKTFRLGRAGGRPFDYSPGQYITLSVDIEGRNYKRSYSLASSPSRSGIIEITVKRDSKGGVVSNWLNDNLKVGDTVNFKGPFGSFSCTNNQTKKILFLAAGSGIVPIMSMLRWLTDTEVQVEILLLLSFRTQYDIIFQDELKLIAARHSNVKLLITLTKELSVFINPLYQFGRINQNMIFYLTRDLTDYVVYLCGSENFMTDCKIYLEQLQLPSEQLLCESFSVNSPVSSITDSIVQRVRKKTGSYQIRFANSKKAINADGSLTVLELAEQSGISLGHECRAGNCGECMVKCLQGHVEMTEQAEIDEIDKEKGWIYSCCAYPVSNLVLDI